eukprot:2271965-Pyramimonas_sp.AAC.1
MSLAPAFCTYLKAIRLYPHPVSIMNRIDPRWTVSLPLDMRLCFLADAASALPPPPSPSCPSSVAGAGSLSSHNLHTSCSKSLAS